MPEPTRHHYIPVFYLKQWCGADGRLCEYSQPHKETRARRKAPKATGFVDCLYTVPDLPPEEAQFVEKRFLQVVDSVAADALRYMLLPHKGFIDLDIRRKIAWSQFLYSLMVRTPQVLDHMQRRIDADPKRPEVKLSASELIPGILASRQVVPAIAQMRWSAATLSKTKHEMLTSDRPLIMTNGLAMPDAHLVIPLSPRVACTRFG